MLFRILKGALPFLVIAVVSRTLPQDWVALSWAVLICLQVGLGWRHLLAGNMIAWAGVALLTVFLANDSLALSRWMDHNATMLFYTVFAATGFASVLLRRPFSLAQARLTVPAEYWSHPIFLAINRVVSLAWSTTFLSCALLAFWSRLGPETTPAVCYGLIVMTMVFTDRYPAFVRQRRARVQPGPLAPSMA